MDIKYKIVSVDKETNSIYIETKSTEYYYAAMRYYDLVSKMIEHIFNSPFKSQLYLTQLIDFAKKDTVCAPLKYIIVKNMFIFNLIIKHYYSLLEYLSKDDRDTDILGEISNRILFLCSMFQGDLEIYFKYDVPKLIKLDKQLYYINNDKTI